MYVCTYIHIIHYLCVYVYIYSRASDNVQSPDISSQIKYMLGQIKFVRLTLVMEILLNVQKKMNVRTIFNPYHKHCYRCICMHMYVRTYINYICTVTKHDIYACIYVSKVYFMLQPAQQSIILMLRQQVKELTKQNLSLESRNDSLTQEQKQLLDEIEFLRKPKVG